MRKKSAGFVMGILAIFMADLLLGGCSSVAEQKNIGKAERVAGREEDKLQMEEPEPEREESAEGLDGDIGDEPEEEILSVRPVPLLPETGGVLSDFIPAGWSLLDSAELDFNEDGITDYVGVADYKPESAENEAAYYLSPRILFAVFGDSAGIYHLSFQDINLIRAREEGGVFGDPYMPMTAEGKSFTTHSFGGSAWKWSENNTYTYEKDEWYLTEAEKTYGYGPYITDYEKDDYVKGIGIRKARSDSFEDMDYNMEHADEELSPDQVPFNDKMPYDLVYEVPLDEPPTLYQASMRWWLSVERRTKWDVDTIEMAEGISLKEDEIKFPDGSCYFEDCDENQAVYTFSAAEKYYLALYRFSERKLYILTEEAGFAAVGLYHDRVYYAADVTEMVTCQKLSDGELETAQEEKTIGIRLFGSDFDGSDKEEIFEYFLPIETDEVLDGYVPYLSLIMELTGDQIIAEVYIGNGKHPYYRMDMDGSHQELLGTVPARSVAEQEGAA